MRLCTPASAWAASVFSCFLSLATCSVWALKKARTRGVSSNTCRRGVDSIDPKVFIWHENSRKKLLVLNMPIQNHSWKIWKSRSRHKTSLKLSWEMLQILHHHHQSSSSSSSSKSSASGLRMTCPEYHSLPVRPAGNHAASARPAVYEL